MSDDTERCCTNCGKSVEDLSYEFWLFHTCRSCALDASPDRWGDGKTGSGTYRKWRYFPRWHMAEHPEKSNHWRTKEIATDGGTVGDEDDPWAEWIEYQQNEIDGAHERIKDRMAHVSGAVENGILTATHVQEHQNDRLEAYLQGYSDALEFAASEVSRIENLVKYAESATQDGDSE